MYTCKEVYYKELTYVITEAEPSQKEWLSISRSSQGSPEKQNQMEIAHMIMETSKPHCLQEARGIDGTAPKSESLRVGGQMMDSGLSPSVKAHCPSWKMVRQREGMLLFPGLFVLFRPLPN